MENKVLFFCVLSWRNVHYCRTKEEVRHNFVGIMFLLVLLKRKLQVPRKLNPRSIRKICKNNIFKLPPVNVKKKPDNPNHKI